MRGDSQPSAEGRGERTLMPDVSEGRESFKREEKWRSKEGREGSQRGKAVLYINPKDLVTHAVSVARFP